MLCVMLFIAAFISSMYFLMNALIKGKIVKWGVSLSFIGFFGFWILALVCENAISNSIPQNKQLVEKILMAKGDRRWYQYTPSIGRGIPSVLQFQALDPQTRIRMEKRYTNQVFKKHYWEKDQGLFLLYNCSYKNKFWHWIFFMFSPYQAEIYIPR
jgi:hypothetical protein